MASSSPKHLSTIFLIALFFIASFAHARESQFFSKATKETTTTQQAPNKEKQQQEQQETLTYNDQHETLTNQQVDQPNFTPETTMTTGAGYGLYGHETGQLPPSTTTATFPKESLYSNYESNNNYKQYKNSNGGNGYYYYNKDSYATNDERATGLGNHYSTNDYGGGNVKQQGMSDTRFMENGKYYYDVNNEEKYYPNYRYGGSRTTTSRSSQLYNPNMVNGGYYGNNYVNRNYEYNGNSVEGYGQNQGESQEVGGEFDPRQSQGESQEVGDEFDPRQNQGESQEVGDEFEP